MTAQTNRLHPRPAEGMMDDEGKEGKGKGKEERRKTKDERRNNRARAEADGKYINTLIRNG